MKCIFCKTQMLPMRPISGDNRDSVVFSTWECLRCPNAVRQIQAYPEWFSLMTLYKDNWYELSQTFSSTGSPRLVINRIVFSEDEEGGEQRIFVHSERVLERRMDAGLTPQNVESKLPTILVFS